MPCNAGCIRCKLHLSVITNARPPGCRFLSLQTLVPLAAHNFHASDTNKSINHQKRTSLQSRTGVQIVHLAASASSSMDLHLDLLSLYSAPSYENKIREPTQS
uniref:Uncharacterized protein n=1 Tax=Dunaliella tertiolecta TaxID=3047 RepID=A0A7S3VNT1_DUNTE|eukprot:1151680-Pelagomonas_calceolata.AAC.1